MKRKSEKKSSRLVTRYGLTEKNLKKREKESRCAICHCQFGVSWAEKENTDHCHDTTIKRGKKSRTYKGVACFSPYKKGKPSPYRGKACTICNLTEGIVRARSARKRNLDPKKPHEELLEEEVLLERSKDMESELRKKGKCVDEKHIFEYLSMN